jgi:hypothetical protein
MGIVIDSGSRGTLIDTSAMFNSRIVIAKNAAQVEVRAGGNQIGVIANGTGVRLSGMPAVSTVTKGPSLTNFYNQVSVYSDSFKLDEAPPQSVGGFVVGYDPYNNPGPVRTISFSCLFHKDLVGGGYPNFALSQESNGVTRLNGSEVWISVNDNGAKHMDFQLVGGVLKIGAFGTPPAPQQTIPAAATDLASVIALANAMRTALNALGWTKTLTGAMKQAKVQKVTVKRREKKLTNKQCSGPISLEDSDKPAGQKLLTSDSPSDPPVPPISPNQHRRKMLEDRTSAAEPKKDQK